MEKLKDIGKIDSVCPYCENFLSKRPSRKAKCPHCGKFIFVRTRPLDRKRVLVTESEAEAIENQWARVSRTEFKDYIDPEVFEKEKRALSLRFGCDPSDNDVRWSILNQQLLENSINGNWGLYRNTRLSMGGVLEKEGKFPDSLATYLEVCYLDVNGPSNTGGYQNTELLKKLRAFSPDEAFLAPAVIDRIVELLNQLELSEEDGKRIFYEHNRRVENNLKLPVTINQAWELLSKEIYLK